MATFDRPGNGEHAVPACGRSRIVACRRQMKWDTRLADSAGEVIAEAELAWIAAKVVLLLDAHAEYEPVWRGARLAGRRLLTAIGRLRLLSLLAR